MHNTHTVIGESVGCQQRGTIDARSAIADKLGGHLIDVRLEGEQSEELIRRCAALHPPHV